MNTKDEGITLLNAGEEYISSQELEENSLKNKIEFILEQHNQIFLERIKCDSAGLLNEQTVHKIIECINAWEHLKNINKIDNG